MSGSYGSTWVTHSVVQGDWEGSTVLDVDPLFVSLSTGDLRLSPDSPCRNAGWTPDVPLDECDLDWDGNTTEPLPLDLRGSRRIMEGAMDMGAFETRQLRLEDN